MRRRMGPPTGGRRSDRRVCGAVDSRLRGNERIGGWATPPRTFGPTLPLKGRVGVLSHKRMPTPPASAVPLRRGGTPYRHRRVQPGDPCHSLSAALLRVPSGIVMAWITGSRPVMTVMGQVVWPVLVEVPGSGVARPGTTSVRCGCGGRRSGRSGVRVPCVDSRLRGNERIEGHPTPDLRSDPPPQGEGGCCRWPVVGEGRHRHGVDGGIKSGHDEERKSCWKQKTKEAKNA
jgi:hypothetical protein